MPEKYSLDNLLIRGRPKPLGPGWLKVSTVYHDPPRAQILAKVAQWRDGGKDPWVALDNETHRLLGNWFGDAAVTQAMRDKAASIRGNLEAVAALWPGVNVANAQIPAFSGTGSGNAQLIRDQFSRRLDFMEDEGLVEVSGRFVQTAYFGREWGAAQVRRHLAFVEWAILEMKSRHPGVIVAPTLNPIAGREPLLVVPLRDQREIATLCRDLGDGFTLWSWAEPAWRPDYDAWLRVYGGTPAARPVARRVGPPPAGLSFSLPGTPAFFSLPERSLTYHV